MSASGIAATAALALAGAAALAAGEMSVWIAPDTCKVNPRSGNMLEEHTCHEGPSIPPPGRRHPAEVLHHLGPAGAEAPPPGSVRVDPEDPYRLRNHVAEASTQKETAGARTASNTARR